MSTLLESPRVAWQVFLGARAIRSSRRDNAREYTR
jgi:hypothetical protein